MADLVGLQSCSSGSNNDLLVATSTVTKGLANRRISSLSQSDITPSSTMQYRR
jgi:hypothetical protein